VTHTLLVVAAVLAAMVLAVVALRVRKLRRDERRLMSRPVDRRLVSPPPSPYQPSRGFRLLDGTVPTDTRPTPQRPRLEPSRDYVFSELSGPGGDERPELPTRHDAEWALTRSQHRAGAPAGARFLFVVVVLIAGISVAGYALRHHGPRGHPTTTLVPTTVGPTSTTTWPARLSPASADPSAKTATYLVPASRYVVAVSGAAGAVWTVYRMGAANTLEFQGTVASGHTESLEMTGVARVTLGSPHNASVSVGGSPVTLPTPLSAPLTLVFTPVSG
jgi:hypothetical protein